jgi:hypothetical protein
LRSDFDLLVLLFDGIASGLIIALIEETFLRGAMRTAITRESGAALAIGLTSVLYAAFHFVSGRYHVAPEDVASTAAFTCSGGPEGIHGTRAHCRFVPGLTAVEYCWASCAHSPGTSPPVLIACRVGDGDLCAAPDHHPKSRFSGGLDAGQLRRLHRLDGAGVDPVIGWILYLWYGAARGG